MKNERQIWEMKDRGIKRTIQEMKEFTKEAEEKGYILYAVTLTYRIRIFNKNRETKYYIKLPKQKIAINHDMKFFKDGIIKAFKRKGIDFECFFIYSKPYNEWPHFHGIIAISKRKKLNDYVKKYWARGIIKVKKIYNSEGWISYIKKNVRESTKNYSSNHQIKSRTRKKKS